MQKYGKLRSNLNAAELDSLMLEFKCCVDMLKAVQTVMAEGSDTAETYMDALFGVLVSFWNLNKKFSREIYEVADDEGGAWQKPERKGGAYSD